jgi:hypothetical protein
MRTCARCEHIKRCPNSKYYSWCDLWTRRRWVTVLMIAAFIFGLIGAVAAGAVLVDSLTRPHVERTDAVRDIALFVKPLQGWNATMQRMMYGDAYFWQVTTIGVCEIVTGQDAVWIVDGKRITVQTTWIDEKNAEWRRWVKK